MPAPAWITILLILTYTYHLHRKLKLLNLEHQQTEYYSEFYRECLHIQGQRIHDLQLEIAALSFTLKRMGWEPELATAEDEIFGLLHSPVVVNPILTQLIHLN